MPASLGIYEYPTNTIFAVAANIPLKNISEHIEPAITPAASFPGCNPNQGLSTEPTQRWVWWVDPG